MSIVSLGMFAFLAGLIVAVVHLLNRKVEGLLDERARNEAMLQDSAMGELQLEQLNVELRHRLKNTFAVIGGLVSQSARYSTDIASFASALSGRLAAMGTAMDLVATRNFTGASLTELVADTLKPLVPPGRSRVEIKGPETMVPGDVASALGLTLHELGTNAIKYGAWSNERGSVSVTWQIEKLDEEEVRFELDWQERGGPVVTAPERRGLGTTLIDSGFPSATGRAFLYARRRPLPHRGRHKANDHTAHAAAALATNQLSSIQIQRAVAEARVPAPARRRLPAPEVWCASHRPA